MLIPEAPSECTYALRSRYHICWRDSCAYLSTILPLPWRTVLHLLHSEWWCWCRHLLLSLHFSARRVKTKYFYNVKYFFDMLCCLPCAASPGKELQHPCLQSHHVEIQMRCGRSRTGRLRRRRRPPAGG